MSKDNVHWVFSLDIGAKCSGYCFGAEDGYPLKYGKYVAKKDEEGRGEKLYAFTQWLAKTVNSLPHTPTRVVIEAPYYRHNIKTFGILSQYVGVADRELYRIAKVNADFLAPSAVKSYLQVTKGKTHDERKYLMVVTINKRFNLSLEYHKSNKKISDDDIADAIGLFVTYCARLRNETP